MDYCSSCRRHLNGALMCPGCGAYAPDIAPVIPPTATDGYPVPGLAAQAAPGTAAWEAMDEAPRSGPSDGLEDVPPAPQGRAARRRQLARWKKNQRRAVVATAVALVGGGLTVSAMDRQSTHRDQASTAPETPTTPAVEEPTSQHIRPAAPGPATHRSTPAAGLPRTRSVPAQPGTTPPSTHVDAAPAAHGPSTAYTVHTAPTRRTAATPAPAQGNGSSSSGSSSSGSTSSGSTSSGGTTTGTNDTAPQQTSAPAPANGTDQGTSQTDPATSTPSSPQLCLLVVCVG
ncbi:SCO2400 family protein [Streptomyces sp. NPDC001348]